MSSSTVNKVVLKSNTTMTLSDRFSDIMKMKSPKKSSVQNIRAEQSQLAQASSKNKRLAEQMARRSGVGAEAPVQAAAPTTPSIKNRLGATKTVPTKARLGTVARGTGLGRGRGIYTRGRGMNKSPSSGFSPRGRGFQRGRQRGATRGGGGFNRGRNTWQAGNNVRGRGRGRGGQGATRGRGAASKSSKEDLDKELDSYMGVSKKNHLSFDSADNWS